MKLISKIIIFCYLLLLFFTPIIFTSFNSELFELPKTYFVLVLTIIIFFLHLINHLQNNVPLFRRSFMDIPFILFLLSQVISTITSIDPHTSFFGYYSRMNGGLLSTLSYLTLYWVLNVYLTDSLINKLIHTALISGLIVSIYGILEHFGIDKHLWVQDVQNRVFSTLGQPNWLAAYLCILIPFSVSKFLNSKTRLHIFFYSLLSTLYFLCLLFTKSKSGILAAIISLGSYLLIATLNKVKRPKAISLILVFILFSITITNPVKDQIFPPTSQNQATPPPITADTNITASEDIRKIVWQGAIDLWKRFPILGTGVETFAYSYYWTRPASHNLTSEWDFLYNKAHNEYLNYLATSGALGLSIYLLIIFIVIKKLIKNLKIKNEIPAILASFLSILITNFAGFSVVISSVFFFLLPSLIESRSEISIPTPPQKENFFAIPLAILSLLICGYFLNTIVTSYLADISYAHSENIDTDRDPQSARDYISAAIKFRPSEPLYHSKLSTIAAKIATADKTKRDEYIKIAVTASDRSVDISPSNLNFWKERAQMYLYLSTIDSEYFSNAVESLISGTRLAPTDAKLFYLLGRFYQSANQNQQALLYFQKAVDLKANYDHAYFDMGKIQFNQKDYQKAKESFISTIKIAPKNIEAQNYLNQIEKLTGP